MRDTHHQEPGPLPPEYFRQLYRRHLQGAWVRSAASLIMWMFALLAYAIEVIGDHHFLGVSLAVFYLIALNPPTLCLLKRLRRPQHIANFSTGINLLEILGYTAVIYSLGGLEATYLTPIYAALITYIGAMSERWRTFLVAGICAAAYTAMILLEGTGLIPWYRVNATFDVTWTTRTVYLAVVVALMLIVAHIASYTAGLRRKNRNALREKNTQLERQTHRLQQAERDLRATQHELELRVEDRTAELSRANEVLRLEILERSAAERSLKETHETFLTVLDSIDATIYVADFQTHEILFMNRHMREAFGRDATGMRCWDVFRNAPEPCPHCTMDQLLNAEGRPSGAKVWETENPVTRRWYINYDRAIKWVDGRWVFLQIATDITQLKLLEKERREAEARLHRGQKMEALGMLAGGVAHDLNNILSGIVSYPELLLMDLPPDNPLREPIVLIKKSGERAAAIVQDLLNLARRAVVTMEVVSLNGIVQDYLDSPEHAKLLCQHPGCRLEVTCQPGLMNIRGAPSQLTITLMNLVCNALEAMPAGGTVTIVTTSCYLDRTMRGFDNVAEGEYTRLSVSDRGVGIAPEDKERIFEPFYTKKVLGRSGTGLGMAVVWGVVKDHKGFIDVQSAVGEGTTFQLFFPVCREAAMPLGALPGVETYRGRGESVLVVDDVAEQRQIACGILEKLGYRVSAVASGEAALDFLRAHNVDLMVLDMILASGMDGLETFNAVRSVLPDQRAIIASGFAETDRVTEALRIGAGAYVRKPYSIEQLGQAVRLALQTRPRPADNAPPVDEGGEACPSRSATETH